MANVVAACLSVALVVIFLGTACKIFLTEEEKVHSPSVLKVFLPPCIVITIIFSQLYT